MWKKGISDNGLKRIAQEQLEQQEDPETTNTEQTSHIVFEGFGYTAAIAGYNAVNGPFLTITRKGHGGKYVAGDDALMWCEELETALDAKEAAALCKAIYNS
jgi:hypothetical protein